MVVNKAQFNTHITNTFKSGLLLQTWSCCLLPTLSEMCMLVESSLEAKSKGCSFPLPSDGLITDHFERENYCIFHSH